MAGIKDTAISTQQSAREAISTQQSAFSQSRKRNRKNTSKRKTPHRPKRRRRRLLRFPEARGKTVEFIEMDWAADFPCVEVGFDDKTALLFVMGARLTMEPSYSDWKTGNQRLLRQWPAQETS